MAFWDKISSRGSVDDRRGMSPIALGGGGLGIGGIVLVLLLNYLSGGDLGDALQQIQIPQVASEQINSQDFAGSDQYEVFVSTVLGSNNDMWSKVFQENNLQYHAPTLVLFNSATNSGCGIASAAVGPHYCPEDETIYMDESFFDELQTRFKAQGGDVAQAYVISHEVGHHVQNQLGILGQAAESGSQENSIRLELQADCFAGLWAYSIKDAGVFEPGEIKEALDAAAAVGDDRIQQEIEGRVNPETWTHGSSEQRVGWFNIGFTTGSVSECNTFE